MTNDTTKQKRMKMLFIRACKDSSNPHLRLPRIAEMYYLWTGSTSENWHAVSLVLIEILEQYVPQWKLLSSVENAASYWETNFWKAIGMSLMFEIRHIEAICFGPDMVWPQRWMCEAMEGD